MSIESFNDQNAVKAAAGNSERSFERRALGTAERRNKQHPVQMVVFGGSRPNDKAAVAARKAGIGLGVVWFAFISLALAAWPVSKGWLIKPGTGLGFYFGLVGGVMMLLMLLYPLRKHVSWARSWGPLRYWFMVHMVFGIGGPALVLFHSTFHVKSLNAGVALYSMLLVALSGIIGRFIYKRIHLGLYGRKANLEELQRAVDFSLRKGKENRVTGILMEATGINERLIQFRGRAFTQGRNLLARAWQFMTFDWNKFRLTRRSRRELWRAVIHMAQTEGWDKRQQTGHFQDSLVYVSEYLGAVKRAAQFSTYERLFRLWHVLHSPFVWLLGISGIVHVIATQYMY